MPGKLFRYCLKYMDGGIRNGRFVRICDLSSPINGFSFILLFVKSLIIYLIYGFQLPLQPPHGSPKMAYSGMYLSPSKILGLLLNNLESYPIPSSRKIIDSNMSYADPKELQVKA